jgi:hypothetical protein
VEATPATPSSLNKKRALGEEGEVTEDQPVVELLDVLPPESTSVSMNYELVKQHYITYPQWDKEAVRKLSVLVNTHKAAGRMINITPCINTQAGLRLNILVGDNWQNVEASIILQRIADDMKKLEVESENFGGALRNLKMRINRANDIYKHISGYVDGINLAMLQHRMSGYDRTTMDEVLQCAFEKKFEHNKAMNKLSKELKARSLQFESVTEILTYALNWGTNCSPN